MANPNTAQRTKRSGRCSARCAASGAADLPGDLIAGLTLAAIAIPEQMATARLGGFEPQIGFFAFIAGSSALPCSAATASCPAAPIPPSRRSSPAGSPRSPRPARRIIRRSRSRWR